jgi:hypothetical protein
MRSEFESQCDSAQIQTQEGPARLRTISPCRPRADGRIRYALRLWLVTGKNLDVNVLDDPGGFRLRLRSGARPQEQDLPIVVNPAQVRSDRPPRMRSIGWGYPAAVDPVARAARSATPGMRPSSWPADVAAAAALGGDPGFAADRAFSRREI